MHCRQCGVALSSEMKFCARCGSPVMLAAVPMAQPSYVPMGGELSEKSKVVAGVLQLFFGSLGIGRFYTGHVGIAIAQIAATWLTCGIGAIWPIIDGIILLVQDDVRDAQGRRLRP